MYAKVTGEKGSSKYAFLEFKTLEGAATSVSFTGREFHGRPIKVGKANNPIQKTEGTKVIPKAQKISAVRSDF